MICKKQHVTDPQDMEKLATMIDQTVEIIHEKGDGNPSGLLANSQDSQEEKYF
jgi:hypothetical protein